MGIFNKKHTTETDPILNIKNTKTNKYNDKINKVEVVNFLEKDEKILKNTQFFIVENVIYENGIGTIVEGTVQKYSLYLGDTVVCAGVSFSVNGIEKDNQSVKAANVGERVKIIFNIPKGMIEKGDILEKII